MLFKLEESASRTSGNDYQQLDLQRQSAVYKDCSERFYKVSRDFSKQYAHIYSARLNTFRNILTPAIKKKWPNCKVLKLCELRDKGTTCVIIGTLFKLQELKPSILKELSDELEIIPQPARTHFVHDSDSMVLEDELQRIKLVGEVININKVVTGVVCALLGSENDDGVFTIKDVCWAGCNIQKPLPQLSTDRYIVIMSGLNLASKSAEQVFSLHLMMEWLSGLSGTSHYQEEVSNIVRVIVAGGVFANHSNESVLNESNVIAAAELVDSFATAASTVAPVDIMPGCKDPAGVMLPQKPFHYYDFKKNDSLNLDKSGKNTNFLRGLFPKAIEYKSFNRVSNPYECDIGGFLCLGSSGEPIKDILRYSQMESCLEAMEKTLQWRHLAPTCPDTVPCTPCVDTDPFTMYNCPSVYFCGNADKFDTELYEGEAGQRVRIVCVPDFYDTKTVAVINLSNLNCFSMSFS